jgi:hypothetical protein
MQEKEQKFLYGKPKRAIMQQIIKKMRANLKKNKKYC